LVFNMLPVFLKQTFVAMPSSEYAINRPHIENHHYLKLRN
jgi:hypothetical protein